MKESIKTLPNDGSVDHARELHLVEDERPEFLKKLDKPTEEQIVASFGQFELKRKSGMKTHSYFYNIDASRYYFTNTIETFARLLFVTSALILVSSILVFMPSFIQVIGSAAQGELANIINAPGGAKLEVYIAPVLRVMLWFGGFFWVILVLLAVLPVVLTKTLKTTRMWLSVIAVLATLNGLVVLILATLYTIYINSSSYGLIISVVCSLLTVWIGSIMLSMNLRSYRNSLESHLSEQIRISKGLVGGAK